MHARCSICHAGLRAISAPTTTPCGHLYCGACASRHFANGAACVKCGAGPHKLESLIALHPESEADDGEASGGTTREAAAVLPRMLRSNPALMVLVVAFVAIGTVLGIFFVVVFSGMVMARTLRALDAAGFFAP